MRIVEVYWTVEEKVPALDSLTTVAYWSRIEDGNGTPNRFDDEDDARIILRRLEEFPREVRLVKVTREVVEWRPT